MRVKKSLQQVISRASDILARYGGEKFVVLLEDTDSTGANSNAEKMRESIIQLEIEHTQTGISKKVTISLGVHTVENFDIDDINLLVSLADDALYKANRNGRNRVESNY